MDDQLRHVALSLEGVFCSGDAHGAGLDDQKVDRMVRAGEVERVRRGTFVLAEALRGVDAVAAYSLRVRAVLRARASEVAASHHAALAVHGLPLVSADLGGIDLVGDVRRRRAKAGVTVHPCGEVEVVRVGGLWPAVTVPVALAQLALDRRNETTAVVAADAALHRGVVEPADLEEVAALVGGWRGRTVAEVLGRSDPLCESVGESRTRLLLLGLGLPVRSQVPIVCLDGRRTRVDFLVEGVVVEFDGAVKYAGPDGREVFMDEKRREASLVASGYEVVRLTWADLEHPGRVLHLIRAAIDRAALRRVA